MFAYKAPINDGFTPSNLHNGYVWLSLCLQAEAWQFTAGADAILLLFSCLSVTPDPPWADPWPPCIMDPHFRYRVHGRNSKTGVSEQRSVQTNLSDLNYRNKIYVTSENLPIILKKSFRGKCVTEYDLLWTENSWIDHPHCASLWLRLCYVDTKSSVITDGEITPASRPNPFACLWDDIRYQRTVPPNRLHCSLLDCERTWWQ